MKTKQIIFTLLAGLLFAGNIMGQESKSSKDAKAYYEQSLESIKKSQYDNAIAESSKAIELKPKYWEAYVIRGAAYAEKGQMDKAIADFSEVIRLNPKDPNGYRNRSVAYSKIGEKEKALADLTQAKRLETK